MFFLVYHLKNWESPYRHAKSVCPVKRMNVFVSAADWRVKKIAACNADANTSLC